MVNKFSQLLALSVSMLLTILGCGHRLHPDPYMSALDANYPSAEFVHNSKIFHGLGWTHKVSSTVFFSVQGYYNGTIHVHSNECGFDEVVSYRNNDLVPFQFKMNHARCLIDIFVRPEFEKPSEVVRGFKGLFLVHKDKNPVVQYGYRVKPGEPIILKVPLKSDTVRMVAKGCSVDSDLMFQGKSPWTLRLDFAEAHKSALRDCVVTGFVIGNNDDVGIDALVSHVDPKFHKLPIPKLYKDGSTLYVYADKAVSVLSLNTNIVFNNETTFELQQGQNVLRGFTVGGRSFICEIDSEGVSECQN